MLDNESNSTIDVTDEPLNMSDTISDTDESISNQDISEDEAQGSEEVPPEKQIAELEASISSLQAKIKELEDRNAAQNRVLSEVGAFTDLFPRVSIDSIPDSVWEEVKSGSSLPAAYALYEKRREAENYRISLINAKNAATSAGQAGKDTAGEYFTPDEVKKMSRSEVHANYKKIRESMKKWM